MSGITTVRSISKQIQLVIVRAELGTVGRLENYKLYRGRFKHRHRKDLHQCVERGVQLQPLPNDGDQHVDRHRDPDLRLHRVFGGSVELLDTEMLLDPFEEKLHLPAALIQIADHQSRPRCQVGQENEGLSGPGILEAHTPEMLGVVSLRIMPIQRDCLIGDHAGSAIGRGRIYAMRVEIGFGAGHEKGAGLVQPIQTSKIDVPVVPLLSGVTRTNCTKVSDS